MAGTTGNSDGSVIIDIILNDNEFQQGIKDAKKSGTDLGEVLNHAFGNLLSQAVQSAADNLKNLAAEVYNTGVSFESAFTGVMKTVDETAEMSYEEINDQLREMAKNLPSSYEELAGVAEAAGQLGIKTEAITDFTQVMVDLGNSTNLSAEQAAVSLAQLANVTKMSSDDYSKLGSAIVDLGNNMATTEADIVAMSQRLGSTASVAGLTNQDILAISAALGSVGVSAEVGGTAMSTFIKKMQTSVETGDKKLAKFAETAGMTEEAFVSLFKTNGIQAIDAFVQGLGKVDANGGSAIQTLKELGITDTRLSNAILSLANNGEILAKAIDISNTAWDENTALSEEAAKRYETTASKMEMLQNRIRDFYYEVSQSISSGTGEFLDLDKISEMLERVQKKVEEGNLGESIGKIIDKMMELGEKFADFAIDEGIPALLDALEWISDHGDTISTIIEMIVLNMATDKVKNFATSVFEVAKGFTDIATPAANAATSIGGVTTAATNSATAAATAAAKFGIYAVALEAAVVVGTYLAEELDKAAEKVKESSKYWNDFTDDANEALDAYAELVQYYNDHPLGAREEAQNGIDDTISKLQKLREELSSLQHKYNELSEASKNEYGVINTDSANYQELLATQKRIDEISREIQTYENLEAAQKKVIKSTEGIAAQQEEINRRSEEGRRAATGEGAATLDEIKEKLGIPSGRQIQKSKDDLENALKDIEHKYKTHQITEEEFYKQKKQALSGDNFSITLADDEDYWAWVDEVDEWYDKKAKAEADAIEKANKEAENARTKAEREATTKAKNNFKRRMQDIVTEANELTFESASQRQEYILLAQKQVIDSLGQENELYQDAYDDWIESWRKLQDTKNSELKKQTEQDNSTFKSSVDTIFGNTQKEAKQQINGIKSAFNDIVKEYEEGYNKILSQRDSYKKKLMGESVFNVLQKTDEKTGDTWTEYTIDNLTDRLKKQTEYARQMAALQARGLSQGLMQELEGMDTDTALIFAKQINQMGESEFNQLNDAYKKLDDETTKLANERYQAQLDELDSGFIEKAKALFGGMDTDLEKLGVDGAKKYIESFTGGFDNSTEEVAESVNTFLDNINTQIDEGTEGLYDIIADNLSGEGLGDQMVDAVITELKGRQTDVKKAVYDLVNLNGYADTFFAGAEQQAADNSQQGYAAGAMQTQNTSNVAMEWFNKTFGGKGLTVNADLQLTDKAGNVIAKVVTDKQLQAQRSAGT
jgi:TP901 family phage tail tape measure protein